MRCSSYYCDCNRCKDCGEFPDDCKCGSDVCNCPLIDEYHPEIGLKYSTECPVHGPAEIALKESVHEE